MAKYYQDGLFSGTGDVSDLKAAHDDILDDQIAALRKQIGALSEAAKVPLDKDFQALEDLVESEKAKKDKKAEPVKSTKKTAKKSK
jgi:hypothetical protein